MAILSVLTQILRDFTLVLIAICLGALVTKDERIKGMENLVALSLVALFLAYVTTYEEPIIRILVAYVVLIGVAVSLYLEIKKKKGKHSEDIPLTKPVIGSG